MVIENMKMTDVDEVINLEKECFTHPWSKDNLISELKKDDSFIYLAKEDEKIIAYLIFTITYDQADILDIAVKNEFRNKGIATKLLDEAYSLFLERKINFVTLEVRKSNVSAISLYTKHGFKEVGQRKNYYKDPIEDALLLTKYFEV